MGTEPTKKGVATEGSVVDRIAAGLREQLRTGRLVPGQRLVEADLTEAFAVSRSTVREAVSRLVAEGLLTQERNRSTRVRRMSRAEVAALWRVRESLEGLAARMAAENIATPGFRSRLRSLRSDMEVSIRAEDVDRYYAQNEALHGAIVEMSGNPHLIRLVDQLRVPAYRLQFRQASQLERCRRSHADHVPLIKAILAAEPDAADVAMRTHIQHSASYLEALPDEFWR